MVYSVVGCRLYETSVLTDSPLEDCLKLQAQNFTGTAHCESFKGLMTYRGGMQDGLFHGEGRYQMLSYLDRKNVVWFKEGTFEQGKLKGFGILCKGTLNGHECRQETGLFLDDKLNGQGIRDYFNSRGALDHHETGEFLDGKLLGTTLKEAQTEEFSERAIPIIAYQMSVVLIGGVIGKIASKILEMMNDDIERGNQVVLHMTAIAVRTAARMGPFFRRHYFIL